MGNPSRSIQYRGGSRQIQRVALKSLDMKKITGMIKGHDHHDDPPQEIDRFNPFTFHECVFNSAARPMRTQQDSTYLEAIKVDTKSGKGKMNLTHS